MEAFPRGPEGCFPLQIGGGKAIFVGSKKNDSSLTGWSNEAERLSRTQACGNMSLQPANKSC